jgi:XRE family transcriptional regulator, regulator of sulfur utilization
VALDGAMPRGEVISGELISRFDDGEVVSELYRLRIRAGGESHQAIHAPGLRKAMTVFAGAATVALSDGTVQLAAGQTAEWNADGPHTYSVVGAEDVHAALLVRYPDRWISSTTKPSGSST